MVLDVGKPRATSDPSLLAPCMPDVAPVANNVPENRLLPVFGIMLICKPPLMLSAVADE